MSGQLPDKASSSIASKHRHAKNRKEEQCCTTHYTRRNDTTNDADDGDVLLIRKIVAARLDSNFNASITYMQDINSYSYSIESCTRTRTRTRTTQNPTSKGELGERPRQTEAITSSLRSATSIGSYNAADDPAIMKLIVRRSHDDDNHTLDETTIGTSAASQGSLPAQAQAQVITKDKELEERALANALHLAQYRSLEEHPGALALAPGSLSLRLPITPMMTMRTAATPTNTPLSSDDNFYNDTNDNEQQGQQRMPASSCRHDNNHSVEMMSSQATNCTRCTINHDDNHHRHDIESAASASSSHDGSSLAPTEAQMPNKAHQTERGYIYKICALAACLGVIITVSIAIVLVRPSFCDNNHQALPTPAYTSSQDAITDFRNNLPDSTWQTILLAQEHSPQVAAYEWLIQETNLEKYPLKRIQQRFALMVLRFSIVALAVDENKDSRNNWNGSHHIITSNYHYKVPECEWDITATADNSTEKSSDEPPFRSLCDHSTGVYHRLDLHDVVLSSHDWTLPAEVSMLSSLQELVLARFSVSNNFRNSTIHNLTTTETGNGKTSLSTILPLELTQLSQLKVLEIFDWSSDSLGPGPIPTLLPLMTGLQQLRLNGMQLTGTIPNTFLLHNQMTNLQSLLLHNNALTGSLIPVPMDNLSTNLRTLWLQENQFSGSLPPAWSSLTNLLSINVSRNYLTGSLPNEWQRLTNLMDLRLSSNPTIYGTIPASWGDCMTNLQTLAVEGLNITGSVPQGFCTRLGPQKEMHFYGDCDDKISCC